MGVLYLFPIDKYFKSSTILFRVLCILYEFPNKFKRLASPELIEILCYLFISPVFYFFYVSESLSHKFLLNFITRSFDYLL